jgi:hypothetical protein
MRADHGAAVSKGTRRGSRRDYSRRIAAMRAFPACGEDVHASQIGSSLLRGEACLVDVE